MFVCVCVYMCVCLRMLPIANVVVKRSVVFAMIELMKSIVSA